MNKEIAKALKRKAEDIADIFSNPEREKNLNKEEFVVHKIVPLSENTAAITYLKYPSHKHAIAFAFFSKDKWFSFFPTDGHLLGMESFKRYKAIVEEHNFELNFKKSRRGEDE